jgi:hypothetical protein
MAPKSSATSRAGARPSDVPRLVAARSASCFGSSHSFCWSAAAAARLVSCTGDRSLPAALKTRWTSAVTFARSAPGRTETRTRAPPGFPTLAEMLSTPAIPFSRASTGASRCAQPARVGASCDRPSRKTCSRARLALLLPTTPAKLPSARLAATRSAASQATRRACRYLAFPGDRTLNPIFAVLRCMGMSPHRLKIVEALWPVARRGFANGRDEQSALVAGRRSQMRRSVAPALPVGSIRRSTNRKCNAGPVTCNHIPP